MPADRVSEEPVTAWDDGEDDVRGEDVEGVEDDRAEALLAVEVLLEEARPDLEALR